MTKSLGLLCLLSAIVLSTLLSACSKDKSINAVKPTQGNYGYFSVEIGTISTRYSDADYNSHDGTADESKVNQLRLVLYDQMKVKYAFDLNATVDDGTNGGGLNSVTNNKLVTSAREILQQPYKLLVLVNPNDHIKSLTSVGCDYGLMESAYNTTAAELTESADGTKDNFFMCNWQGLEDLAQANIADSEDEAYVVKKNVKVERAVAKVVVTGKLSDINTNSGAVISDVSWGVDVVNKKVYYMRKQALMRDVTNDIQIAESNDVSDRHLFYATDPNYDNVSNAAAVFRGQAKPTSDMNVHFNYYTDAVAVNPLSSVAGGSGDNAVYDIVEYVTENTMAASEQYLDVTTSIIFKCKYYPARSNFTYGGNQGSPITVGSPYYVYKNYVFTPSDLDKIVSGDVTVDADLHPALSDFSSVLAAFLSENGLLAENGIFTDCAQSSSESVSSLSGLMLNHDGVNYYRLPIRHYNDHIQPTSMGYGRFGVVRNNFYKITITEIKGPGMVEVKRGPEESGKMNMGEKEGGNMSAGIEMLSWVMRENIIPVEG